MVDPRLVVAVETGRDVESLLECPICGEPIDPETGHKCDETPADAGGDVCSMCGQNYDSYLDHLKNCPAEGSAAGD